VCVCVCMCVCMCVCVCVCVCVWVGITKQHCQYQSLAEAPWPSLTWHIPAGTRISNEKSGHISLIIKMQTVPHLHTSLEHYHYSNLLSHTIHTSI